MQKIICSVYDKTIQSFAHPFVAFNEGSAMRDFFHACKDPQTSLYKSPQDFSLIQVGIFDDETGTVTSVPNKIIAQAVYFDKE